MDQPTSLLQLCTQKLAANLIKYGPKKVRFGKLTKLPGRALEALLDILVAKNALNDNVLPHALTRQTQRLVLEGAAQLRRCVLNTIGRSCPQLQILDVRSCHQVDNRIVRDVLQYCARLESLRLDGCIRISDSAFAPALWKPPLAGLLGLRELSVGKCGQITAEGLMGYVVKGAPYLRALGVATCKICITDDVASELLCSFGLEVLDISSCTLVTDVPFQSNQPSMLRELRAANTAISDAAVQGIARRAPKLEVVDAGWVLKLSDSGVSALVDACTGLRSLCICNTQITDDSFRAIARCCHMERLDASWCLRATPAALEILAASDARPPLRELVLDHLGALELGFGLEGVGQLPPPASPVLLGPREFSSTRDSAAQAKGSWGTSSPWLPFAAEPPSLALPPAALGISHSPPAPGPLSMPVLCALGAPGSPVIAAAPRRAACAHASEAADGGLEACGSLAPLLPPPALPVVDAEPGPPSLPPPTTLKLFVSAYARSLQQLLLEGVRGVAHGAGLQAIAAECPNLRQLALTFPKAGEPGALSAPAAATIDGDMALEAGLLAVGASCCNLNLLRLDSSARPHKAIVQALALPSFPQLQKLTLVCSTKDCGLLDSELEMLLKGRTSLEALALRNCEGLSEGLFPGWCNRRDPSDDGYAQEAMEELDQAIFASLDFGFGRSAGPLSPVLLPVQPPVRVSRRRRQPACPAAQALRTVTAFSLGGATSLTDRAADALAELLHDAQTVELRGCPLLTEEAVRSFRKGCRFIRSMAVVTRERTLSWTAATSAVKKHHHRRSHMQFSASSGTESN